MIRRDHRLPVLGLFADLPQAERAIDALHRAGNDDDLINLVVRDEATGAAHVVVTVETADPAQ